ncbi:hypothetical protein DCAR_0206338 [Daucus carota subsp. sativus]|uniref:Ubiquitin carboxyl-terminal hydrolase n=1 Tax=Daucus carota subsp. sativus TaxID=79200 RepID=A0AAF0WE54_DAUCS|nr:PREDICTED: ubiquitin carboxyl-terminal hydrolase 20-like [Daucus carota subsp. sativus]WOG87116.1 hypothetical protein DCAR_0206338 [Daucus carota subsp. sativus]
MDTHLIVSGEEQNPPPDSLSSQQTLDGYLIKVPPPPTETLVNVDTPFPVPDESVNIEENGKEEEALLCPSPINTYSGYLFDDTKPLSSCFSTKKSRSCSPVFFDDKAPMVGAGLTNLGNTCFLNAIVQCFTHTVRLIEGLRSFDHVMPCDRNVDGFCLLCSFRAHVEYSLASVERVISPWKFVDNLSYFSSDFQKYQQEDAHEFLQCFLDRLESSCSDLKSKETTLCANNDNFVKQVFGGRLVSKLKCCNCDHISDTYEPSIDLSLEIKDVTTLQDALESFTKLEKIEDPDTKFMCENCKEEVSIEKQLILEEAPSVASFHLKRFENDGSYVEKIDKHVKFPLELDLQPYTSSQNSDAELKYELYAIVVHIGFSATSGHYYSFIRSAPDTWYKFDDSRVVRVREEFVLSQSAYILFYAKQGTPYFSSYLETIKPFLDPHGYETSPKSVLDDVDIHMSSPNIATTCNDKVNESSNTAHENEYASVSKDDQGVGVTYKNEVHEMSGVNYAIDESSDKDDRLGVDTTLQPGTSIPMKDNGNGMKVFSPSVLQEYDATSNADNPPQTPPRSSSPDIYKDESPEFKLYIQPSHRKLVNQVSNKKQLKKEVESAESLQARRLLKTMPGGRGKSLLAAMAGQFSEDAQRNKKRKRMQVTPNKYDSPSTTQRKDGLRSLARPLAAAYSR